ncbi:MAG: A/G-specific adenine glycosylase [Chitinophagales bacterium]|nr:MAG: A/G-specific adenine glycosylase [Chitinophagales bacterium]
MKEKDFAKKLLQWHQTVDRSLPWKGERNPYLVWLSEIILQQTRAEQGVAYYLRFKETFPDLKSLALATEDDVLRMWQGLGYYTRARNLHHAARYIYHELAGKFPDNYTALRKLKGVGPYTAAAIAAFAFNQPCAVVDSNVYRVLSRIFGIFEPVDSVAGKKFFTSLAERLMDPKAPALYNQAIMDFGAVQCTPRNPFCENCPFKTRCYAFQHQCIELLPIKKKKPARKVRYFHYLVLRHQGYTYLMHRNGKDIWKNLYEFPMIEGSRKMSLKEIVLRAEQNGWILRAAAVTASLSPEFSQTLTHQKIHGSFAEIVLHKDASVAAFLLKIPINSLDNYAFPGIIRKYLQQAPHLFLLTAE